MKADTVEVKPIMFHNIPVKLKRRFKVACTKQGRPMQEVIAELMERYAREHES